MTPDEMRAALDEWCHTQNCAECPLLYKTCPASDPYGEMSDEDAEEAYGRVFTKNEMEGK